MRNGDQRQGWPVQFTNFLERPSPKISAPIGALGVALFAALVCIGILAIAWLFVDLVSGDQKRAAEATKAALPVLAGVIGLPLIIWRLLILDRQTKISETKTQIDRETHYTSIFARAIDQLGQTREVKRTIQTSEGSRDTAATAPNIEVRLGGIHSLTRLAEESARDKEKIENVLLSYVRENSWSDRSGNVISPWQRERNSAWDWSSAYWNGRVTHQARIEQKSWQQQQAEQSEHKRAWGSSLAETRVDVSEALDGLAKLRGASDKRARVRFRDCLFVGVKFHPMLLEFCLFDRCSFSSCDFGSAAEYAFSDCDLINCTFNQIANATALLRKCHVDNVTIQGLVNTSFRFLEGVATDLTIHGCIGGSINLSRSVLLSAWISGDGETEMNLTYAALASGHLRGFKASPTSNFEKCALVNTQLDAVDLTDVHQIKDVTLATTRASPATRHPQSFARPSKWPGFDPDYDPDDIPF